MEAKDFNRRQLLTQAGAVAALASLWPVKGASAQGDDENRRANLVFDVACIADTFRAIFPQPPEAVEPTGPPSDIPIIGTPNSRGAIFIVEGLLYKAGTIPGGEGFDPFSVPAEGHWLCRGWFLSRVGAAPLDRVIPHAVTTQEYLFGLMTPDRPSPPDTLVSSGVEGGIALSYRAIIGGSGQYRRVGGDLAQEVVGFNTTAFIPDVLFAPNFRFHLRA